MNFTVNMHTIAIATIRVELSNERLVEIAAEFEKPVGELTLDDLRFHIEDAAYEQNPVSICAQCSGWGRTYGLELGDEWMVDDNEYAIQKEETKEIT